MKIRHFFAIIASIIFISSCNDDLSTLGFDNVKSSEDSVSVNIKTFGLKAQSFELDSIAARSITGTLGNFNDPAFGSVKTDYMCQFFCQEGTAFPDKVIDSKIDSIDVLIFYMTYSGDSLAPMQANVYRVEEGKTLERNFYTNINPMSFCDPTPIGQQVYTASNIGMPDSIISSSSYSYTYKYLRIRLPKSFGQEIYDKSKTDNILASRNAFNDYLRGLYITANGTGIGSIINVIATNLNVYYRYETTNDDDETEIVNDALTFEVTKEVIQLNHYKNDITPIDLDNPDIAFIKTPGAVFTSLGIPLKEINDAIKIGEHKNGHITNSVALSVKAYATPAETVFPLKPPTYMMVIPKEDYLSFFETPKIPDAVYLNSYVTAYDTTNLVYKFNNLTPLIEDLYERFSDKDTVQVYLVPVTLNQDDNGTVTSIAHYLRPAAVRIRKHIDDLNLKIVYSKFEF